MIDLRQTKEYAKYMRMIGWKVEIFNKNLQFKNYIFIKKIPLLGNVAKLQRPQGVINAKQADEFAKKHHLAVLYIEPSLNFKLQSQDSCFQPASSTFLPSKTIHLDLLQSKKSIFQSFSKNTRWAIKKAEKKKVKVSMSHNIDEFIRLWQKSAFRRGMFFHQAKEIKSIWNAFSPNATILMSKNMAAVLLVHTLDATYYMYACSTKQANKLSAPSLLVWEGVKLAKKKGCKVFDFEGIYDERYKATKSWKGFTRFKMGFGGKVITYPPTLVKYYNPIAKLLHL